MASPARSDRAWIRIVALVTIVAFTASGCMLDELLGNESNAEPNEEPPAGPPSPPGPGAPAVLIRAQGNGQADTAAATLAQPYTARVTDAQGRPVSGVTIQWSVASGGGRVAPSSSVTNANGIAVAVHTLGTTAGGHSVLASVAGLTSVTFVATARHGTAAALEFVVQPTNVRADERVTPSVKVRARDTFGNTVTAFEEDLTIDVTPGTGTPGARVRGSTEEEAEDGVGTFDNVRIRLPGLGYRLRVSGRGFTADSAPFNVLL
jgi:hypothetical protein